MKAVMEAGGPRKVFSLSGPPPKLYKAKTYSKRAVVKIFEIYQEQLPLESGHYTYVIDSRGRFRVERGNTRSHAGMVGGDPVGAAGNFWVTREGKVGRVACLSRDYHFYIKNELNPTVQFVIDSFRSHQAMDLSPYAVFTFSRGIADSFRVTAEGKVIADDSEYQRLLEEEGQGPPLEFEFTSAQIYAFREYSPVPPPRLYDLRSDQFSELLTLDEADEEPLVIGPPRPHYEPDQGPLSPGRKAFVIDSAGRLIVGFGHHLISGGHQVGAAGQLHVEDTGRISEVNLNFSGHYRPPLSAEYARFTYRSLFHHPLLAFSPNCRISARKSFDLSGSLETLVFSHSELMSDDLALDVALDRFGDLAVFDQDDPLDDGENME
jgi:hypothetical protein